MGNYIVALVVGGLIGRVGVAELEPIPAKGLEVSSPCDENDVMAVRGELATDGTADRSGSENHVAHSEVIADLRPLHLQDDRHRSVVHQFDLHVGPESAG